MKCCLKFHTYLCVMATKFWITKITWNPIFTYFLYDLKKNHPTYSRQGMIIFFFVASVWLQNDEKKNAFSSSSSHYAILFNTKMELFFSICLLGFRLIATIKMWERTSRLWWLLAKRDRTCTHSLTAKKKKEK